MAALTNLNKHQIKFFYRSFKQECPFGVIDESAFKQIYAQIFLMGDSTKYAHFVFIAIDAEGKGAITFGDFIEFLSGMANGGLSQRLEWIFQFYDINKDGRIDREELLKVKNTTRLLLLYQKMVFGHFIFIVHFKNVTTQNLKKLWTNVKKKQKLIGPSKNG